MNHPIILSLVGVWLFLSGTARAANDRAMTGKTTVDGMVCSFCAQGLVTHFKKHPAVSNVHVDLTRKVVLLEEKKGASISDKEITEFIKKSGFEPKKVERLPDSFEKVKADKKS